jgi:ABC-type branched-subunit amino acid transport system ATPase component
VLGVADHAVVMVQGRIAAAGDPADIGAELSSTYLGVSA